MYVYIYIDHPQPCSIFAVMAVQPPHHLNQFPSHLFSNNRDDIVIGSTSVHHHHYEGSMNNNVYNNNNNPHMMMMNSCLLPLSGTTTTTTTASDAAPLLAPPLKSFIVDQKPALRSDSPFPSRKRSRDHSTNYLPDDDNSSSSSPAFSFLGQDLSPLISHQQLHLDRLISHHMEKVRVEVEERRKRQARRVLEAMEVGMVRRLREKEEEMERIAKLNWALQEKVKSLCVENQLWRDLAQTNEATANALRTNLQQVLTHQFEDDADAHSCCGSTKDKEDEEEEEVGWMCRNCGREESCVLILPCRHLCLCAPCASSLHSCPLCKSFKTATLHVNLSSSSS